MPNTRPGKQIARTTALECSKQGFVATVMGANDRYRCNARAGNRDAHCTLQYILVCRIHLYPHGNGDVDGAHERSRVRRVGGAQMVFAELS
jgi:hypothetical protein